MTTFRQIFILNKFCKGWSLCTFYESLYFTSEQFRRNDFRYHRNTQVVFDTGNKAIVCDVSSATSSTEKRVGNELYVERTIVLITD